MFKNIKKSKKNFLSIVLVIILLLSIFIPFTNAKSPNDFEGFDKGPSSLPVVPMKKITLIQSDKKTLIDDYAYLASVPTSVFTNDGKLFSNPLLFYEDEFKYDDDKERTLNPYQGIKFFLDDYYSYCNNNLDKINLINVQKNKIKDYDANEYFEIHSDDPFKTASDIALEDWSYSNDIVLAVIESEYKNPEIFTQEKTKGVLYEYDIGHKNLEIEQPIIGTGGTYKSFDILDMNYKYVVAEMTWENRKDLDIQIFDKELGMVDNAAESYNNEDPRKEIVGSFIHNYGEWEISVTAVPKKSYNIEEKNINDFKLSLSNFNKILNEKGNVNIKMYPGEIIKIKQTPFGCRNADFELTWDNPNVNLGFTLLDPKGTEICSSLSKNEIKSGFSEKKETNAELHVDMLGECRDDDYYSVCVFSLDDITKSTNFKLEYSWQQNYSKKEGDCLSSASNGAVLASMLNAPLLYIKPSKLPKVTEKVLYKLGVKNIHLVNIGNHLSKKVRNDIEDIAKTDEYSSDKCIFEKIKELKAEKIDIIFTTIDPWTYWYVEGLKPEEEYPGARFIGPSSYIAAHHQSPVIIIDNHPQLSQASTYATDFWRKNSYLRHLRVPAAGSMLLSGRQVYDFLEENQLGELEKGKAVSQNQETIITVAGQYDIGTPWDRMFTGAALPGRFWSSPVDTAYAISRNIFYPALIFENPALHGERLMINGSKSEIQGLGVGSLFGEKKALITNILELFGARFKKPYGVNLVQTKESKEEKFEYPTLQTYNTFGYKFNEKAWENWNFRYERADGIIPYVTHSDDSIDDGAAAPSKTGAYYPDLSETEVVPFYAKKAGYDSVFSTEASAVTENLNRGVILWILKGHGWYKNSGQISMWDPNNPYAYEENPWRVYEPILLQPGNIREFIRWVVYGLSGQQQTKFTEGLIKFHLLSELGSTENPDVATINPQLYFINKYIAGLLPIDLWGANGIMIYRDRILHPIETIKQGLSFINFYEGDGKVIISPQSGHQPMTDITGIEFDEALDNVHSCGLHTGACLPACTYMHLTWMRHGVSYQIIDPWTTTDWNGIWNQMLVKRLAMGDTIGQAYEKGMRACGPELLVGQFWWDIWENVCFFGDPDLRPFVPGRDYSDNNYWTEEETRPISYDQELNINGHMPFGATGYPNQREPQTLIQEYIWLLIIILLIIIILVIMFIPRRKK